MPRLPTVPKQILRTGPPPEGKPKATPCASFALAPIFSLTVFAGAKLKQPPCAAPPILGPAVLPGPPVGRIRKR